MLEGSGLSESARQSLQEAWDSNLAEAKEQMTAELREEFAQRYEHDRALIADSVDQFVTQKISEEISELAIDKKQLAEQQVKYRRAIREHAKMLDTFVTKMVAKEVRELHADRQNVNEHLKKLDRFVAQNLSEELSEFHADKKALVEQKVKMAREGRRRLNEAKKTFVSKASRLIENSVNKALSQEISQFRDDITAARENDFGRRIFEAFASEFSSSHLNENKEIRKFRKGLAKLNAELTETKKELRFSNSKAKLVESKLRAAEDRYMRREKLAELTKPLGKEKREIMLDLLESVKTERLDEAFNKYLPSILNEQGGPRKKNRRTLKESSVKAHTGNKAPVSRAADDNDTDVVAIEQIRKLAGLK